jgi:predicted acetyltransferase
MVLAVQEGEVVGRVSIRHDLNAALEDDGGHVGYAVRPMHRRRGHAAALLGHALHVLAAEGTTDALLTCDERNTGSRRTIERAGGRLQQVRLLEDGEVQRRYRVPTQGAAAGPAGRDR